MIGIIAAMQEETAFIKQHMNVVESITLGSHVFITGEINGKAAVLLQCGIGKVNAAVGVALLIDHFKPKHVINIGVAGGLYADLKVGDVIISLEVRHHDVDLTVWGYALGQLPKLPAAFTASALLVAAAEAAAHKMAMQVSKGLIASGDTFIHEEEHIKKIRENFADVYAVEMEGAAIAQVCHQFDIPFVIIRAISDMAGIDSPLQSDLFIEEVSQRSAQLVLNMSSELS